MLKTGRSASLPPLPRAEANLTEDLDTMRGQRPSIHLGLRLYDDGLSVAQTARLAQRAEARGYETVWVPESAGREAFTQLGVYALSTRSLHLATGIVNVYTRSPSLVAMSLATLDEVSGGRAILGLGIGHREALAQEHGVALTQPFERMREYVSLVRAVLRSDCLPSTPICGVTRFHLAFAPERRAVPIYLAALGPRMCELAGEIADGASRQKTVASARRGGVPQIASQGNVSSRTAP
jgi:alkanesulfonate monooxygenase SsuD/methylene tetrahydromethanopterin reductase-like flavin-dependent oxidoreductase (luciferase family)